MVSRQEKYTARLNHDQPTEPFLSAEQAWFWFIAAQAAKEDGARFTAGQAVSPRPCEPIDILKIVDRLYRNRCLLIDHVHVLRHYGRRMSPPDWRRQKEARAARLWLEAMDKMEPVMIGKKIVIERPPRHSLWHESALLYERMPEHA